MQDLTKNKEYPNKSVAIYHTGALGDLLVSSATIYESIHFFPHVEFTLIGSKLWKEIISPKLWPNIKYILEVKDKKFSELKLYQSNPQTNSWEVTHFEGNNIIQFLKKFDVTIDLRTESLRFAWRAFLAKVPMRVGGSKSKFSKPFFTHFTQEKSKKDRHERDRYLEVLLSLDKNKIKERLNYWQENGLPQLTVSSETGTSILINPTASIREKAWSSVNFRELAIRLKEQGNDVAIIGSPQETVWLQEVAKEDFKVIQPQNIQALMQVVSQARLLIANTSSMQFVAASTRTPTVTLMGLAEPEKWGPLGSWSCFVKGAMPPSVQIGTRIFKAKKELNKLNEVLSYSSISVSEVLAVIVQKTEKKVVL